MKAIIFAGGSGTRFSDITANIPKPMICIGNKPILWHIMKIYSHYGINEFIICLGYKGEVIKDYFCNYQAKNLDFTVDLSDNSINYHQCHDEKKWKITLVETGINSEKGSRLKKIERYLDDDINFLTYGDGVANINIDKLLQFHKTHKKCVTISGVHPPARFGELTTQGDIITSFEEKSQTSQAIINGGFMVFQRELLGYLSEDDSCDLEEGTFELLAKKKELAVYKHDGLWACMDHGRDHKLLEEMWGEDKAFWKVW
jgi:glucose-1-phosphate cytidylyltransferase